ncbi:glycosyltransferase family A protein [Pontixanthobacter gangjinensis]|uniref:Glycosyltransferase family 2 protein n=1 Tax=Christiangramia aestuarii TaxID=1028746 RepID=A0A7K1LMM8_9FLAO|nr:glycosyltransferase family A protein [Christiangramia aestuarii]MUP41770.1 glycosyltransferase family 2 protein [Christiangramia aestuarii]
MIYLNHIKGKELISAEKGDKVIELTSVKLVEAFWELCAVYPDELIIWIDRSISMKISDRLKTIFSHDLIMASYPLETQYLPDTIGYIDQLPFINPDYSVRYPTWRMSTDIGGINGRIALRFKSLFDGIKNLGYLLNSIAKTGQQNSLFCYCEPTLVENRKSSQLKYLANTSDTFRFVAQHYKKEWLFVLFFCYKRYENKLPIKSFLSNLKNKSFFKENVDLSGILPEKIGVRNDYSVDVIIPTMGRPEHLKNVLVDLKAQQIKPLRVIVVEQDPDETTQSQLSYLKNQEWPFEIIHRFIHRTGACHARNLALKSVKGDFIFFADDDIRFSSDLLEKSLNEIQRLKVNALNLNCLQPAGETIFHKIKQWGAFGSGTSIVKSKFALQCRFSENLEHGFGEDIDYGLKLRSKGCDIIYHPDIKIKHLKADIGGFRQVQNFQSKTDNIGPKPSPTMMLLVKKYYSKEMLRGYKAALFLKYYRNQRITNPIKYFRSMRERWNISEKMASEVLKSNRKNSKISHGKQY